VTADSDDVRRRLAAQTSQLWDEPGVVDLGIGQPQDALLPVEEFRRALRAVPVPAFQLQYGIERGDGNLRVALADVLSPRYGVPVDPEQMVVSNGNSQAIDWCCAALARPGDVVLVEDPTYFLASGIFSGHGLRVVGLPTDDQGLLPDALAAALVEHRPAFVYTVPTYSNPTGTTTSAARRSAIVELVAEHGSLLVADEVYHLLSYGPAPPPSYCAWQSSGVVVCLGTFSKILAPGLRLGWVQAGEPVLERLVGRGYLVSGGGLNPFAAPIVTALLQDGSAVTYLDHLRAVYARRVSAMDGALRTVFGSGAVTWRTPDGGYFFWLCFSPDVDTAAVRRLALARGAAFQPGARFSTLGNFSNCLRLSFTYYGEDALARAVGAIADAFSSAYPGL